MREYSIMREGSFVNRQRLVSLLMGCINSNKIRFEYKLSLSMIVKILVQKNMLN